MEPALLERGGHRKVVVCESSRVGVIQIDADEQFELPQRRLNFLGIWKRQDRIAAHDDQRANPLGVI